MGMTCTFNPSTVVSVLLWLLQTITADRNGLLHSLVFDKSADWRIDIPAGAHKLVSWDYEPELKSRSKRCSLAVERAGRINREQGFKGFKSFSLDGLFCDYSGHSEIYTFQEHGRSGLPILGTTRPLT